MRSAQISNVVAEIAGKNRAQEITDVIDRIPAHLRPSKGSFEDIFARACAEIVLSANVDEMGGVIAQRGAVIHLARLLCGRSLPSGDCHDACRLQHQCVGSTRLVLASFGAQARSCLDALGLWMEPDQASRHHQSLRQLPQPMLMDLRKAEPTA